MSGFGSPTAPARYATFVRTAQRQSGLIDILKKDDEYYFDLGPAALDHPFIVAPVLASGIGSDAFAGRIFDSFLIEFKRVGRRVLWIDVNSSFTAPPGSSAANALAISVSDSVINSTPVVAEDDGKQHVVVSAAFFLTDFENVGRDIGGGDDAGSKAAELLFGPALRSGYAVDPTKSYVERTKALPANDELSVRLAFSGPPGSGLGGAAPGGHGVRIGMHYSIVDPPAASSYLPRLADDRIGYFLTSHKRFDNDSLPTPIVRYIDRWNFKRGPIVYYLTNEIPQQYKPAIRTALLEWNAAFAAVGIPHAIEVRDQPSDPAWDPDDVRYSTVRWITSDVSPFAAYGPHIADPRTGEILRVEIVIDGEALRSVKRGFVDQVAPTRAIALGAYGLPAPGAQSAGGCARSGACDSFEADSAELAATGSVALQLAGASPDKVDRYAQRWLQSVVLHESGHNFGLRHNFIASTRYPLAKLHDAAFTKANGLSSSVMDYTPVNLSPDGRPQGEFFQLALGTYDRWAIRYGYEAFPNVRRPEDEVLPLRGIADESTRPGYAYATDEDAAGGLGVDPRVAAFDLSSDPLAFDANQFAVYSSLFRKLDRVYPDRDQPYVYERRAFETMLRGYARAALLTTKYVGGIETSRDHRGQPGGTAPVLPVPRADSARAFAMLSQNVFSSSAFAFSPRLLSQLGYDRLAASDERPDFPIAEAIGEVQDAVLFQMFSPDAMSRLAEERYRLEPGQHAMVLDDLFEWTRASVWDDVDRASIDPIHRALQRRFTNLMVAYTLAPSGLVNALGYPSDSASLARYELVRIDARVKRALARSKADVGTRAHLEDMDDRIRHALEPGTLRGA